MSSPHTPPRNIGRYALHGEIASGGMASVHLGRLLGQVGFARTVAIKKLHAQFSKDPSFVAMFLDEARLAARIRHPNVVPTLDVVSLEDELFLVMEYVHGESLARLQRFARAREEHIPIEIAVGVMSHALHGLHAAHEAKTERGQPLEIVHRDISPQNILVGVDGVGRVLDFGIAKATSRLQVTLEGQLKGKLAYMAPEQLEQQEVDRRVDVFAASVVLWELLAGRRLFVGDIPARVMKQVLTYVVPKPSEIAPDVPAELDDIVMRGLDRDPARRYASAREMAIALEATGRVATQHAIGTWVEKVAVESLANRADVITEIEGTALTGPNVMQTISGNTPSSNAAQTVPRVSPSDDLGVADANTLAATQRDLLAPDPKRKRILAIAAAVLALFAAVGLGTQLRSDPQPTAAASAAEPALSVPTTPRPVASTHASSPEPPTAASSPAPPPSATAKPPTKTVTKATSKPAAAKKDCSTPYTVGADGIKRWKPGCD